MKACTLEDPDLLPTVFTKNQLCWGTWIKGLFLFWWELDVPNGLRASITVRTKLHGSTTVLDDNSPQQCTLSHFSDLIGIQQAVISQENGVGLNP